MTTDRERRLKHSGLSDEQRELLRFAALKLSRAHRVAQAILDGDAYFMEFDLVTGDTADALFKLLTMARLRESPEEGPLRGIDVTTHSGVRFDVAARP